MATSKTANAAKSTGRKVAKKSKPTTARQPSAERQTPVRTPKRGFPAYPGSRLLGGLLLVGAISLGAALSDGGAAGLVPGLIGAAYLPALIGLAAVALVLLLRPARFAGPRSTRLAVGATLLLTSAVTLLGTFDAGGRLGNGTWSYLLSALGGGAALLLAGGVIAGCLLVGIPPSLAWKALVWALRSILAVLSATFFSLVGALVWLSRRRKSGSAMEVETPQSAGQARPQRQFTVVPKPEAEVTQPIERAPVIQTVIEEPPHTRPPEDWSLPPITLLTASDHVEVSEVDARRRAKTIEDTLSSFGVQANVREINPGPRVTQFALEPGPGTKVSRITSLRDDLALALAAPTIRIEAPVPGQSRVGIEIPNGDTVTVRLRDVMDSAAFYNSNGKLRLALGRDVTGRAVVGDLARMPHLLIAGATGAGKSACLNSIIVTFLFQHSPEDLRFLMVDPKMVELKTFDGVPHLVWPVVTEVEKVVGVLKYAVAEMERRYKEFSKLGIRNLDGYNRKMAAEGTPMLPRMVIIIDELADLMMAAPEEVEASICRLAQMARAVGIHLILATQRPSVDVLTGLIKANFPSRIAFAVSSQIDSRVILDAPGAERLLGRGDMLFVGPDSAKPMRAQGTFVSDEEIEAVVEYWKEMQPAEYDPQVGRILEAEAAKSQNPHEDPLFAQALELAESHARLSTSLLQRKLRIGYNRAARLMDALRERGELDTELDD